MRRRLLSLVLLAVFSGGNTWGAASPTAASPPPNAQQVFETGATLLRTFYFGFSDVDLNAQIVLHREKLNVACQSAYLSCPLDTGDRVLKELYRSVKDAHLYTMTATEFQARMQRYEAAPQKLSTFGLALGPSGARGTVVQDVMTGSPAEQAGLRPGDVIAQAAAEGSSAGSVQPLRQPDSQSTLNLTVWRGSQRRTVTLHRREVDPVWLPVLYAPADAPAGVLVLRIPSFRYTERVGPRVHALVREAQAQEARGLIIDLRQGPGGSNYECEMAAGAFVGPFQYQVQTPRGTFPAGWLGSTSTDVAERAFLDVTVPVTQQHLAYELKDPVRWAGKTVVLVDARSASCHEYMAYFLQQKGVPVLGEPTYGLMNTASLLLPLPGGGAVAVAAVRSAHTDGTVYPERLTPDRISLPDGRALAEGRPDPLLLQAYEALK